MRRRLFWWVVGRRLAWYPRQVEWRRLTHGERVAVLADWHVCSQEVRHLSEVLGQCGCRVRVWAWVGKHNIDEAMLSYGVSVVGDGNVSFWLVPNKEVRGDFLRFSPSVVVNMFFRDCPPLGWLALNARDALRVGAAVEGLPVAYSDIMFKVERSEDLVRLFCDYFVGKGLKDGGKKKKSGKE